MHDELQLGPEVDLLVRCARRPSVAHADEGVRALLAAPIDWEFLLALAARHRLRPMLWSALEPAANRLPVRVRETLHAFYDLNAGRNLAMGSQLYDVLELLAASGIQAVAFKGPVLAALYGSIASREFNDLDILIRRRDLPRARRILEQRGYYLPAFYGRVLAGLYPASEHHYVFFSRDPMCETLEVHCELFVWYVSVTWDTDTILEEAVRTRVAGREIATLSPENLLIFLSVHGMTDAWPRLEQVVAVNEVLRHYRTLQWEIIYQRTDEMGIARAVRTALLLARHLMDATLPDAVMEWAASDRAAGQLAAAAAARLADAGGAPPHPLMRVRLNLASRERLRDRLRYCGRGAANVALTALYSLPDWLTGRRQATGATARS